MADQDVPNNEEETVETEQVTLGKPRTWDPLAPRDEILLSKEALDARQEAMGEVRKYAGPVSEEVPEEAVATEERDVPPTDAGEPPA